MIHLKGRKDFLNENTTYDHIEIDAEDMESTIKEFCDSIEQWRDDTASFTRLKSGSIEYTPYHFVIEGIMEDGTKLEIDQSGEFNMYGGPYDPKMEKPVVKFDDVDIYKMIYAEALKQGYVEKGNHVDMTRVDLFSHLFALPRDQKLNIIKGSNGINKYNL